MKRTKLNAIIKAIACGTISLSFTPHLFGQQIGEQFNGWLPQMSIPVSPTPAAGFGGPLVEQEIPGTARYLGPVGPAIVVPPTTPQPTVVSPSFQSYRPQPAGEIIVSEAPIFDGKTVFPLGTFPEQGFGEKIISEFPHPQTVDATLIPGTFEPMAVTGDGVENGIPIDEIVQPDIDVDIETDDLMTMEDLSVTDPSTQDRLSSETSNARQAESPSDVAPEESPSVSVVQAPAALRGPSDVAGGVTEETAPQAVDDQDRTSEPSRSPQKQLSQRYDRLKTSMAQAKATTQQIQSQLNAVEQEKAAIEKKLAAVEAKLQKREAQFDAKLKQAQLDLKTTQSATGKEITQQQKMIAKQKESLTKLEQKLKLSEKNAKSMRQKLTQQAKTEQKRADQKISTLQQELKSSQESAAKLEQQLKSAKLDLASSQSAAAKAAAKAESQSAAMVAKMAALTAQTQRLKQSMMAMEKKADAKLTTDAAESKAVQPDDPAAQQAQRERQKRDAAKAAVKRKLAQREAEMKKQKLQQQQQKNSDADSDAEKSETELKLQDQSQLPTDPDSTAPLNLLEKKILELKSKRDQQIADAERKIRAKQQAEIDDLIDAGNPEDSDVVVEAKTQMDEAVKSSREKLKSRYRRKIERLKETLGNK